ncbi:MAG TPA: type II toxin-antitoxin system VapC family toxin [Vicinamibacteria bacterium]|nr:type II toxin-antitoxin system VapC family toxin [Vicinamibacteria bacterium]
MLLDTTVLVDLQRETRRQRPGPANRLLTASADSKVSIAFVTWMEFAEGFGDGHRGACERFLSVFDVLWPDVDTAWQAARISRQLRSAGSPIGDHDLWIAALALQHGRSVASRNERHFRKVPGLSLVSY